MNNKKNKSRETYMRIKFFFFERGEDTKFHPIKKLYIYKPVIDPDSIIKKKFKLKNKIKLEVELNYRETHVEFELNLKAKMNPYSDMQIYH